MHHHHERHVVLRGESGGARVPEGVERLEGLGELHAAQIDDGVGRLGEGAVGFLVRGATGQDILDEGLQLHLGVLLLEGGVRGVVLHREDVGFREVALDHQAPAGDGEVGLHLIQLEEHVRVFVHAVHELAARHQEGAAVVAHAHVVVGGTGDCLVHTVHVTVELQLVHLEDGRAGAHQQST